MADWTLTRRPSELDILVERPGVPGPVAIVRVAPPFDAAMWAAAERLAERIAAGEAGLPGNDEIARLTRERAAMRGYFAALLIRLTRTEVERDEARAERDAAVAVALDATSGPRATHEDFMVTLGSERGARDEARRDLYRVADALGMTLDAEGQGSVAAPTDELARLDGRDWLNVSLGSLPPTPAGDDGDDRCAQGRTEEV